MNILKAININEQLSSYIQKVYYEYTRYKDLLVTINRASEHGFNYNTDIFEYFLGKYTNSQMEYMLIIDELVKIHAPEYAGAGVGVNIDFINHIVTIHNMKGGCSSDTKK